MKKIHVAICLLVLAATAFTVGSCVRKSYDAPPDMSGYDPGTPVNMSITKLKNFVPATGARLIDSDWTIYGVVNADDRSGNWYKQINIEDSTGGITVLIDAYNLYTKYPVGRKIYIKLKGLYLGSYGKLPQIGSAPDYTGALSNIPGTSADNYVIRANYPNAVQVHEFQDLSQLKTTNVSMLNRLVVIDSVEINAADTSKTYAQQAAISSGTSITVEDCSGNKIILRNSGYANFWNFKVPKGKGRITAVYTVYNSTPQLVIRDTTDLQFYSNRCGGGGSTNPTAGLITIDSVRKMYHGADVTLGNIQIKGIVTSDATNKNVSTGNIILQDGNKAITVYFGSSTPPCDLGDSVVINLSGKTLTSYQSALELKTISASNVTVYTHNNSVTPITLTIAALNANFANYESVLVKIANATATGGTTYSGSRTLSDGTGTMTLYTATGALFAGQTLPTGPHSFTGIATPYTSGNELKLRNTNDVQ